MLANLSQKLLRKPARVRGFAEFSVLQKWGEIFPGYAQFMRPVSLKKGVLRVATNSASAAHNLRLQGPFLIARVNQYFGYNAVKDIKYDIRHFTIEDEKMVPQLIADDEALSYAHQACDKIESDELRESFEKLASMVFMEKKKGLQK